MPKMRGGLTESPAVRDAAYRYFIDRQNACKIENGISKEPYLGLRR
jgi:hypothetical protein